MRIPRKVLSPTQAAFNTYMHRAYGHEDRTKWSIYQYYPTPKGNRALNAKAPAPTVPPMPTVDTSQYRDILQQLKALQI